MKLKSGFYDIFLRTCALNPTNVAIRQYNNGTYKNYTYSELFGVCEYISQNLQLLKCSKGIIGLVTERNVIVPCIIAAVHKCCTTFMFLDPLQNIEKVCDTIKFSVILHVSDCDDSLELLGKKPYKKVNIFNYTITFYKFEPTCNIGNSKCIPQYSFIARTSGSTGDPKLIEVPVQCIQPNINDLTKLFNISCADNIYFSTPLTFDPSMVEILLACLNGAALVIAPEKTEILFPREQQNAITVWQTTPSKFLQYSDNDIKNTILSANSTLKILALGGEQFNGIKRLKELKHPRNKTRIFTLYGVTEMSCWACVAELDLNKINTNREIPLGNCLSETRVHVEPHNADHKNLSGKIILASNTRKCIVLNKSTSKEGGNSLLFIDTGDIGRVTDGTIYYQGRTDDTIKRFGHKINLHNLENSIMECTGVKTCSSIWLPKPMLLVVYFSSETLNCEMLSDYIKNKLDDKFWPDKIVRVDNLPTNVHGKTSKSVLFKMAASDLSIGLISDPLKVTIMNQIKSVLSQNLTYKDVKNKSFLSLGGTSFQAISMCNRISIKYPQLGNIILPHLISSDCTIENLIKLVEKKYSNTTKLKNNVKRPRSTTITLTDKPIIKKMCETTKTSVNFHKLWEHDTGKCVDASPTLFQTKMNIIVAVGSHSGKVIVVDAMTGKLQGTLKLDSRIEASIYCSNHEKIGACGIVGTYNGTIICFNLENCQEIWKINIGHMIKSKAVACDTLVYIAAYDGNIHCIDIMTGAIKNVIKVTKRAISANLALAKNAYILLGTLSGVCASVHVATKKVAWRGTLSSPVFAGPALYDQQRYVVFAEVNGEIHCRTVEKGIKIWKYHGIKGNIFSSLRIKETNISQWQMVFGCHDNAVYSINIANTQPSLHWKAELTSPVYSTPCFLNNNLLIAVSNNGKMCVIESNTGNILSEYSFPNETFSSPVVYDDHVFIGCRNDYLYCIKCKLQD